MMNWSTLFGKALKPQSNRARIVLWSCLAGLIFGIVGLGEPLENLLRDVRSITKRHAVSGEITLVGIDNRSLEQLGRLPWPRTNYAKLTEQLHRMGARRVVFGMTFVAKSDPRNDAAFAQALQPLGRKAVLPVMFSVDPITDKPTEIFPLESLRSGATLADLTVLSDSAGTVRRLPYSMRYERGFYRSVAAEIAGVGTRTGEFVIDYSLDPATIPTVSAVDIINGVASPDLIAGKDVVIGLTYKPLDFAFVAPGFGLIPPPYMHILGAETLKEGPPVEVSWLATFLAALGIITACALVYRRVFTVAAISFGITALFAAPFLLERRLIYVEIIPSLFLLLTVAVAFSWREWRRLYRLRGTTNPVSGLPNLAALHMRTTDHDRALVAARVHNYAAIASTLSAEGEKNLVDQIAKRLMVGSVDPVLYQGDEGIFAWFTEGNSPSATAAHLDALHTLFRSPVLAQGKQFDLRITFGFDAESDRSNANRLASALVAADEAFSEGAKWKQYDPAKLEDASWRLSLLSQLEAAIDAGDLWVAYQPKLDLRTNCIIGAEALARWTHPEKGPISPMEFILAAEESNRIEKLTEFVLDRAVRAAAAINDHGVAFNISVNLSGRLIDDVHLVPMVKGMLSKHRLGPDKLTLEVTETFALSSNARNLKTLEELRELGISISVDDYGTGLSTLDYLQRIPATEIKIDKSFVMGMRDNQGLKVMVNSTIQLAHSLGQEVVAEGVEDQDTLQELIHMNCDLAQGYLIGRPMTFRALSKRILERPRQLAG